MTTASTGKQGKGSSREEGVPSVMVVGRGKGEMGKGEHKVRERREACWERKPKMLLGRRLEPAVMKERKNRMSLHFTSSSSGGDGGSGSSSSRKMEGHPILAAAAAVLVCTNSIKPEHEATFYKGALETYDLLMLYDFKGYSYSSVL